MTKNLLPRNLASRLAVFTGGLLLSLSVFASEGGNTLQAGNDLSDRASLQRGAQPVSYTHLTLPTKA